MHTILALILDIDQRHEWPRSIKFPDIAFPVRHFGFRHSVTLFIRLVYTSRFDYGLSSIYPWESLSRSGFRVGLYTASVPFSLSRRASRARTGGAKPEILLGRYLRNGAKSFEREGSIRRPFAFVRRSARLLLDYRSTHKRNVEKRRQPATARFRPARVPGVRQFSVALWSG